MRAREPLIAGWLDLGSAATAELTAAAGFDAVIVDIEQGAGDEAAARGQIAAAGGPVLVRTPDGGTQAGRMLDAGAAGVILPRASSTRSAWEVELAPLSHLIGRIGVAEDSRAAYSRNSTASRASRSLA